MWSIIVNNQSSFEGDGLHTSTIFPPKFTIETDADLEANKGQFIGGLKTAVENAALAQPEYLIMGMSLEHIIHGLREIQEVMDRIVALFPYSWATWHDAADAT
ncbi:MAG: hypothetical protein ACKOYP_08770 [Bacteroidota bacterium]